MSARPHLQPAPAFNLFSFVLVQFAAQLEARFISSHGASGWKQNWPAPRCPARCRRTERRRRRYRKHAASRKQTSAGCESSAYVCVHMANAWRRVHVMFTQIGQIFRSIRPASVQQKGLCPCSPVHAFSPNCRNVTHFSNASKSQPFLRIDQFQETILSGK